MTQPDDRGAGHQAVRTGTLRQAQWRQSAEGDPGRWLLLDPDVLLSDDPTIGVDPHTREVIFATITSLAHSGAIILIGSSEPDQLGEIAPASSSCGTAE